MIALATSYWDFLALVGAGVGGLVCLGLAVLIMVDGFEDKDFGIAAFFLVASVFLFAVVLKLVFG